ncbi:autotransporter outer membrane beta-barrel domain-containing protein, partial [uncultured Dialister sp.]|uniref:autotransporter outer membrane beta-barrel domain-containing protein n=1 Tax=uncultured Dialister sp. TaxID=278064 RepID=UPI002585615D
LKGRVEIAEGLTSPSAALGGDITFTKTGKGSYRPVKGGREKRSTPMQKTASFLPVETTPHTLEPNKAESVTAETKKMAAVKGTKTKKTLAIETAAKTSTVPRMRRTSEIIYGDKETQMMKGSKTAMTAAALLWRGNNNDLERRMGDIRLGKEENGIWARYLGGKNELDKQNTYFKQTYNIAQAGYDKKRGNWTIGAALDYGTGKDTYASGTGKEKLASLSLYGTMQKEDGQYMDIILKGSRIKNDYTVYNEMGHRLEGKYRTNGLSLSVEYGKRMKKENGFYIDPSIEVTAGHLRGKDYDAVSDYTGGKKMHIRQDGINSVIGRIGLGIGKETERSNLFAKIALAHEFGGKVKSTFSAENEPTSGTEVDLKDSWVDVEIGGSLLVNRNTYLYGTYTRNFGADVSNKWRIDAGIRFSF